MSATMKKQELDNRIKELEEQLNHVQGTPTEIYTRIVGYYRSLKNWNKGKREEYNHRRTFDVDSSLEGGPKRAIAFVGSYEAEREREITDPADSEAVASTAVGEVGTVLFFSRQSCPNCPMMRKALDDTGILGEEVDVDSEEGFELARRHEILATPTVLMLDGEGEELRRVTNPLLLKEELQETA